MDEVVASLRTHPQQRGRLGPGVDQLVCPILRALGGRGLYSPRRACYTGAIFFASYGHQLFFFVTSPLSWAWFSGY